MINSIIFTLKLWYSNKLLVLINYLLNQYSASIILNPKKFILLPISFIFIIAYPSLYSIYINPSSWDLLNNSLTTKFKVIKINDLTSDFNYLVDLRIDQFYLTFTEFSRKNLLDSFLLQNELTTIVTSNSNSSSSCELISPLLYWNNSPENLINDLNFLKTINVKNLNLNKKDIFNEISIKNGLFNSANQLKFNLLHEQSFYSNITDLVIESLNSKLNSNLACLGVKQTFKLVVPHNSNLHVFSKVFERSLLLMIFVYFLISFNNIKSIRSKSGLILAYGVEFVLSILSSVSIVEYMMPNLISISTIVNNKIFISLLIISFENMLNLAENICDHEEEISTNLKIYKTLLGSEKKLFQSLCFQILSVALITNFDFDMILFVSLVLLIDHLLLISYFIAVLSVDLTRLELQDLLQSNDLSRKYKSGNRPTFVDSLIAKGSSIIKSTSSIPSAETSKSIFLIIFNMINLQSYHNNNNSNIPISNQLIFSLLKKYQKDHLTVEIKSTLLSTTPILNTTSFLKSSINYSSNFIYFFELSTILIFILSISSIVLKFLVNQDQLNYNLNFLEHNNHNNNEKVLNCIELNFAHTLDIWEVFTQSNVPFVLSLGLDKRIFVWSPLENNQKTKERINYCSPPTEITLNSTIWPVSKVVMSDKSSLVALIGKNGIIDCYSRLNKKIIWRCELKGCESIEIFFREKTTFGRKSSSNNINTYNVSFDQDFKKFGFNDDLNMMELIVVCASGNLYTINCYNGDFKMKTISNGIKVAKKLSTPRLNDRLVIIDLENSFIIATVVSNNWVCKKRNIKEGNYNRTLSGAPSLSRNPSIRSMYSSSEITYRDSKFGKFLGDSEIVIRTIDFIGMIIIAKGTTIKLIDIQTGILLKNFYIGQFKLDSIKIFHSEPQHCKFCGCISISSLSLIYNELDSNLLILHTFSIDNRAKNNICLRVERDPRETRCLGFDSVNEHQYWLQNVDCWNLGENNLIMGMKRKQFLRTETYDDDDDNGDFNISADSNESSMRHRANRNQKSRNKKDLCETWEFFTMNTKGLVEYYELPSNLKVGLVRNKIQDCVKFGNKAVVITFGNNMKVLYIGDDLKVKDEMIRNPLTFISKRRV